MIVEVEDLICGYKWGMPVLGPLSFGIGEQMVTCLLGPNGIGKTTLLKTMLGLLPPLGGTVTIEGKTVEQLSAKELARNVAYVPQTHIPPFPYRVRDMVVMGRNPTMGELAAPKRVDFDKADEKLAQLGIGYLAERDYTQLSGGEQQLVLIARALAQETKLMMMDEPTSHLDYGNEVRVLEQVEALAAQGYTIVMISHSPEQVFRYAHRVIAVGRDGFFDVGTPEEVMTEENLRRLYGVNAQLETVRLRDSGQRVKVCVPVTGGNAERRDPYSPGKPEKRKEK